MLGPNSMPQPTGKLQIRVVHARGLKDVGLLTIQDPFVQVLHSCSDGGNAHYDCQANGACCCSWSWALSKQSPKLPRMVGPAQTGTTQSRCECTACQGLCQNWHPVAPLPLKMDRLDCQALINCPCSRVAQNSPDALAIKVKVESLGGLSNTTVRGKALCQLQKSFLVCNKALLMDWSCWLYLQGKHLPCLLRLLFLHQAACSAARDNAAGGQGGCPPDRDLGPCLQPGAAA